MDKINAKYLRTKSSDELKKYLNEVENDYRNLKNTAIPAKPGYKITLKLEKHNPHPKQIRKTIARIKTILKERQSKEKY